MMIIFIKQSYRMDQGITMKKHRLFIHKLHYQSSIAIKTHSHDVARKNNISSMVSCEINEEVELCSIGRGKKWLEEQMYITITQLSEGEERPIATLSFDFNHENPPTKNSALRHKQLIDIKGTITYKYLSTELIEIDSSHLDTELNNKKTIELNDYQMPTQAEYHQMIGMIEQKDDIIRNLEEKMKVLLKQIKSLKEANIETPHERTDKHYYTKNPFSINVNLQSQTHQLEIRRLFNENQNLLDKIKELEAQVEKLQDHIDEVESELSQNREKIIVNEINHKYNKNKLSIIQPTLENRSKRKTSINVVSEKMQKNKNDRRSLGKNLLDSNWEERRKRRKDERKKNRAQDFQLSVLYDKSMRESMVDPLQLKSSSVINKCLNQSNSKDQPKQFSHQEKKKLLSLNKIQEQKQLMEQRFYTKKDQAEVLFKELQKSKIRQRKMEEQLQSYRSIVNYYKSHGISLGEIREQQKQYLKNLAKRSKIDLNQDIDLNERNKQSVIQERLRFQIVEIKSEIQKLKSREKSQVQQRDLRISQMEIAIDNEKTEKQIIEKRARQLQDMFEKEINKAKKLQEVADKLEPSLSMNKDLEQRFIDLSNKLNKESKEKTDLQAKIKRIGQLIESRQAQFSKLKSVQANHDVLRVRCASLQQSNQKMTENYKQLKRFAMRIQQLVNKKPKKQGEGKTDQQHNKDILKGLQQLQLDINKAQKQFYKQQLQQYNEEKKMYEKIFLKRIADEKKYIDNLETIKHQEKQQIKQQKEKQINKVKQQKLDQLNSKIQKLVKKIQYLQNFKPLSNIEQRIQEVRKKMIEGSFVFAQSGINDMRQTIQRLQKQIQSKDQQLLKIKKIGNLDQRSNIRTDMMNDFLKTKQMLSKPFEDIKKINHQLMKQKNVLEIQMQNNKIKEEQLLLKFKQKDREIQKLIKKNQEQLEKKKQLGLKTQSKLRQQIDKSKAKILQQQSQIKDLIDEIKNISDLLQKKQIGFNKLQDQNKKLLQRLQQYQEAQKLLIQEVNTVKKNAHINQSQFQHLFLERDQNFLRIQKVKNIEIEKLKDQIYNLQSKLQKQLLDALKIRDENDRYVLAMAQYDEKIRIIRESQKNLQQNHLTYVNQNKLQIQLLQQQIESMKTNLIQLAEQITQKELQNEQLKINKQYDSKKIKSLEHLQDDLRNAQQNYFNQRLQAQHLIEDQTLQIKKLQANYQIIQSKTQSIADENNSLRTFNIELKDQIDDLKSKLKTKQIQLLTAIKDKSEMNKNAISIVTQKQKKLEANILDLTKHTNQLNQQLLSKQKQLEQVMSRLKELQQWKINNLQKIQDMMVSPTKSIRKLEIDKSNISRQKSINMPQNLMLSKKSIKPDSPQGSQIKRMQSRLRRQNSHIENEVNQEVNKKNIFDEGKKNSNGSINIIKDLVGHNSSKDFINESNISGLKQIQGSNVNIVPLQKVKQKQGQGGARLTLGSGKTQKMLLVRKNSKVQFQVSECESQDINQKQKDFIKMQQSEQENVEDEGRSFYENEEQQYHQAEDVVTLLDKIQMLKEEKQVLVDQIQNQKKQIDGLKGELLLWRNTAFQQQSQLNQPSIHSISHGFTSEMQRKLSNIDIDKQRQIGSKRSIKQPENSFSKSAVVEKPSKVLSRLSQRNIQSSQEVRSLQIMLQEAEQQVAMHQKQLEEERKNIEKLIGAVEQLQTDLKRQEDKNVLLQNQNIILKQENQFLKSDLQSTHQKTIKQINNKNQIISSISNELSQIKLDINTKQNSIQQLKKNIGSVQSQLQIKIKLISNMKRQFRKYEEQAQLEILKLKQNVQKLKLQIKNKKQDLQNLGQRYLQIQQQSKVLKIELQSKESLIVGKQTEGQQLIKAYNNLVSQLKQQKLLNKNLQNTISKIKSELTQKEENINIMSKQSSITIKKYCIRLESLQGEAIMLRKKLQDKQQQILKLKNEIAIYNDSVIQLTKQKQQTNHEVLRLQSELKQIMRSYQAQLDQLNGQKINSINQVQEYSSINKQKQSQINILNKQINQKNRQIKQLNTRLDDLTKNIQRLKIKTRNQVSQVFTELQLKNDQLQKVKKQLQRQNETYFSKQCQYISKIQENQGKFKELRQKLINYQKSINQLSQEMVHYSNRPSIEQWEEVSFQNQLYRNRISQLQNNLRKSGISQQQLIYAQFKKYKVNKQHEIQQLEAQMGRYSSKVTEAEQNVYYLKKQIQGIKHQLKVSNNQKQKLQSLVVQLQSQNQDMKLQIDLLKARRAQDIGRVLDLSMN